MGAIPETCLHLCEAISKIRSSRKDQKERTISAYLLAGVQQRVSDLGLQRVGFVNEKNEPSTPRAVQQGLLDPCRWLFPPQSDAVEGDLGDEPGRLSQEVSVCRASRDFVYEFRDGPELGWSYTDDVNSRRLKDFVAKPDE